MGMVNSDITRIINSDEVQSKVKPADTIVTRRRLKKNPLKNLGVKVRLNPYALTLRRSELLAQERREASKAKKTAAARASRKAHPTKQKKANFARISDKGVPEPEPEVEVEVEAEDAAEEPAAAAPAPEA